MQIYKTPLPCKAKLSIPAAFLFFFVMLLFCCPHLRAQDNAADAPATLSAAREFGDDASLMPQGNAAQGTSSASSAANQDDWLHRWMRVSDRARATQPHYTAPMVSTNVLLTQQFRYDMGWQSTSAGVLTSNYGSGKGLEIIPTMHMEVQIAIPPYIVHESKTVDGFGDLSVTVKYRLFSAPETKGFYFVGAFLGVAFPTGALPNGSGHYVLTPTFAAAKGWGHFDIQNTLSGSLPTSGTNVLGRSILLNNTFQYNCGHQLWTEVEVNSTFFTDGPSSGQKQVFLTPGIIYGNFKVAERVHMKVGFGVQIATTHFHAYKQREVFSVRFPY